MNGMELLLKSLGINPAELQAQFKDGFEKIRDKINSIDEKLQKIEERQLFIETKTDELLTRVKLVQDAYTTRFNPFNGQNEPHE